MPKRRKSALVDTVSSQTMGANSFEIKLTVPDIPSAIDSAFFIAILFGTSSPNISVKYESIIVIMITEIVFNVDFAIGKPSPERFSVSKSEKLSAANALPKNPARVIAT